MKLLSILLTLFIVLLCGAPAIAREDCACNSNSICVSTNNMGHDDCECCSCSPFTPCATCSGFIVTKTTATHSQPISVIPEYGILFIKPELLDLEFQFLFHYDVQTTKWEFFASQGHKLRGSPTFS